MRVVLDIPDKKWFQLGEVAEKQNVQVSALLMTAIDELVSQSRAIQAKQRAARVVAMARDGFPDVMICERTEETREYVARNRRRAGIPANRIGRAS